MKSKSFLITAIILISVTAALIPSITKADVHVYDNNDQSLGILMSNQWASMIELFVPSVGGIFKYWIDPASACGDPDDLWVYFQSGDCSGTPYAKNPFPAIYDFSPTPIEGFYKVDYNGKQTFTPGSYLSCDCVPGPGELAEYYPYVEVQMPFTPPVALPLKFKVRTKTIVVPLSD